MDTNLASGDINIQEGDTKKITDQVEGKHLNPDDINLIGETSNHVFFSQGNSQPESVSERDLILKDRIANCKKIIESLKLELTEEKAKLKEESKCSTFPLTNPSSVNNSRWYNSNVACSNKFNMDNVSQSDTNSLYNSALDTKLLGDDNLMEYEKQLQRYQDTLTMAQTEKKNAIRKQMLTKVYKLKLLEVENQCNIELLRVKQSLQCLEPLQMIINKWKIDENNTNCDLNSYELIPGYPELKPFSTNDINIFTDDEKREIVASSEDS